MQELPDPGPVAAGPSPKRLRPLLIALAACAAASVTQAASAQPGVPQPQPPPAGAQPAQPAPPVQPAQPAQPAPPGAQPPPAPAGGDAPPAAKDAKKGEAKAPNEPTWPAGTESRPKPEYDGRAEEGASVGDGLLWIPRVVFFPLYVVTEFVLRRPLHLLIDAAERGQWVKEITEFFTFGPTHNIGIIPTALLDFGFRTSIGVYMFYDDFLSPGNAFRVHAAWGFSKDWLRLTVADRIPIDESSYFKLRFEASSRPDFAFYGIGPESQKDNLSRYKAQWLDFAASFVTEVKETSSFEIYNSVRPTRFFDDCCGDLRVPGERAEDPTLAYRVQDGDLTIPPGFEGYTSYRQGMRLALDSRKPRPAPGTGLRLDLGAEHAIDMQRPGSSRWVRYGANVGGFLDLTGQNRVLSLSINTQFADPLDDDEVPFTELVQLGGDQAMRGFRPGRLMGRSAAVATLEYRYPIWAILDGSVQAAMGNVFGAHLDGFDPDLMRLAFTVGIRSSSSRDTSFDILFGAGTETFKDGAALNSVRFVLGSSRTF